MKSHAITLLCFFAAAVCYLIGFGFGVELAVVISCFSELIFWVRVSLASESRDKLYAITTGIATLSTTEVRSGA